MRHQLKYYPRVLHICQTCQYQNLFPISAFQNQSYICVSKSMCSVWKEVKFGLELNTSDIGLLFFRAFSVICSPESWVSMFITFIRSVPSFSSDADRVDLLRLIWLPSQRTSQYLNVKKVLRLHPDRHPCQEPQ